MTTKADSTYTNGDPDVSEAALFYLVFLCQRAIKGRYSSSVYNYYDAFQHLSKELAAKGYVAISEHQDDEFGLIQAKGYQLIRRGWWFSSYEMGRLDTLFSLELSELHATD